MLKKSAAPAALRAIAANGRWRQGAIVAFPSIGTSFSRGPMTRLEAESVA